MLNNTEIMQLNTLVLAKNEVGKPVAAVVNFKSFLASCYTENSRFFWHDKCDIYTLQKSTNKIVAVVNMITVLYNTLQMLFCWALNWHGVLLKLLFMVMWNLHIVSFFECTIVTSLELIWDHSHILGERDS